MKKKLIICFSILIAIALLCTVIVCAADSASEETVTIVPGARYESNHGECCTVGSDEPHYNNGYDDGWLDAYDQRQPVIDEQNATIESQNNTIISLEQRLAELEDYENTLNNLKQENEELQERLDELSNAELTIALLKQKLADTNASLKDALEMWAYYETKYVEAGLSEDEAFDATKTEIFEWLEDIAIAEAYEEVGKQIDGALDGGSSDSATTIQQTIQIALDSKYQEGVEQGKADYQVSVEYKAALEGEYKAGAEAGQANGYIVGSNEGYAKGLLDGAEKANEELYNLGVKEFKNSSEYKTEIQNTYNRGYTDGADESSGFNPIGLIIFLIIDCVVAVVIAFVVRKVRKNKNR